MKKLAILVLVIASLFMMTACGGNNSKDTNRGISVNSSRLTYRPFTLAKVNVDNPGANAEGNGNGYGGADTPTPITEPAKIAGYENHAEAEAPKTSFISLALLPNSAKEFILDKSKEASIR